MQRIWLLNLAIAFAGAAGGALAAHAATTTASRPIYKYDHSARFVQSDHRTAGRMSAFSALTGAAFHDGVRSPRPVKGVGVAAEEGAAIVASDGTRISSFTGHGIDRVIGDGAKRDGVKPQALLDALRN